MQTSSSATLLGLCALWLVSCQSETPDSMALSSPDGAISADFRLAEGVPQYAVRYAGDTVLHWAELGLKTEKADFRSGLNVISVSESGAVQDDYELLHGKVREASYRANERTVELVNAAGKTLRIVFRVSDDGMAFRYELDAEGRQRVTEEATAFRLPEGAKAWLQPMSKAKTGWESTNPSYEEHCQAQIAPGTPSPIGAGWAFPALFQAEEQWLLISEANVGPDDCASRLSADGAGRLKIAFPQAEEVMPEGGLYPLAEGQWQSPWRFVAIGSLPTIVASTLGTDLAAPAIDVPTDQIEPGVSSWSWVLLKDDYTVYPVQKQFIDYASAMEWQYCLVDADWDQKIGYEKIAELADYAATKDVRLLLWYNSAGSWNSTPYTPKDKMLTAESRATEFKRLKEIGIAGLKVDFFGGDGQSVMAYYHDIMRDAAQNGLLLNFHGATLPRGWHRTYPNLMTIEAIKGEEFVTFEQANADKQAEHCAIIPFTRNVFDPMDFTPMCFSEIPGIERKTSNGFELALPVLFTSGVQHMAETPDGMKDVPDYVRRFVRALPVSWDEVRLLGGYPGKDAVIARRKGEVWYVAGINGEPAAKELTVDLSGLGVNGGYLIKDGSDNRHFEQEKLDLSDGQQVVVPVLPNGGFVMQLETN